MAGGVSARIAHGRPAFDLLLLTFAAGMMDALSYFQNHVFTANMTGNAVVLGLSLAGSERSRALPTAVSFASFALGAFFGAVVLIRLKTNQNWHEDLKVGTALELPWLAAFASLYFISPPPSSGAIALALTATAACAMGIQSVAAWRLRIAGVSTTFITGTLTAAAIQLAAKDSGAVESDERSPSLLVTILAVYVLAAAVGAGLSMARVTAVAIIPFLIVGAVEVRSWAAA